MFGGDINSFTFPRKDAQQRRFRVKEAQAQNALQEAAALRLQVQGLQQQIRDLQQQIRDLQQQVLALQHAQLHDAQEEVRRLTAAAATAPPPAQGEGEERRQELEAQAAELLGQWLMDNNL
jgi:uncharacterized protein YlxW (UPF0749 family)